ncbi:HAMP domain-containing histidine kinase [Marinobacter halodurans]|uniref:histidine kinase n=1 Tax=Marinobacter halodurans TaxID=2528979 RepID=A0ABY1ZKZ3_9GAMM|nr:HAMP domain-containing sensor histidine kinase [Marinobacter halodurans]TBW54433.1 HAMP domain-containing histidine kinase [Marinobacter halodurans]
MTDADQPDQGTKPSPDFAMVMASAVHDMKNSLGMLLHSLDELRDELSPDGAQSPRFNTLRYEAERVHSDLVQLLGLYRLDQSNLSAHVEEHFVPDYLEAQLARHVPLLDGRGISYEITADPISGFFDADLLSGVLNDTLNNAIRYTDKRIRMGSREENGYLVIQVADDGKGYPASMLSTSPGTSAPIDFDSGSTRLGLYFADAVARLHQEGERTGFVRLFNGGPLGGGVFEIHLP